MRAKSQASSTYAGQAQPIDIKTSNYRDFRPTLVSSRALFVLRAATMLGWPGICKFSRPLHKLSIWQRKGKSKCHVNCLMSSKVRKLHTVRRTPRCAPVRPLHVVRAVRTSWCFAPLSLGRASGGAHQNGSVAKLRAHKWTPSCASSVEAAGNS